MREAFEDWAVSAVLPLLREADGDTYESWCTQMAWEAWQAADAAAVARERERCAKVCEDLDDQYCNQQLPGFALEIAAAAIRKGWLLQHPNVAA